jgi:hypothetical protein
MGATVTAAKAVVDLWQAELAATEVLSWSASMGLFLQAVQAVECFEEVALLLRDPSPRSSLVGAREAPLRWRVQVGVLFEFTMRMRFLTPTSFVRVLNLKFKNLNEQASLHSKIVEFADYVV